jgi:patatin-like phospholipase/acyl hydrolase
MPKKILTIDGGGIKGVFPASFLASIEEQIEGSISEYFDLIVGTSTGGIIALGLGLGFSAKQLLAFYEEFGPDIFKGNGFLKRMQHFMSPKYGAVGLRKALESKFGPLKLGDSKTRLVIPSFNIDTGQVHVYKTSHNERLKTDYQETAVDVALATSSAPTYFPVHYTSSGIPLVDGGLWANNPMGAAAVEAIGVLDWDRKDIKMLSIGCTTEVFSQRGSGGKLRWAPKIADIFMASQSSASEGTAQLLLGNANIIRVNPVAPKARYGIDAIRGIQSLKALGINEARKQLPFIQGFFNQKAEPFEPFYS